MGQMVLSWGRAHRFDQDTVRLAPDTYQHQFNQLTDSVDGVPMLAHGYGRSYGDVALNENGVLAMTRRLNHFLEADWDTGRIRAAAGLSIDELLQICVPRGWFVPVTPGTKFVTLGGAVANDVHGKNHHRAGSIGAHVLSFQLNRSDQGQLVCSRDKNIDLFALTLGGLGLTGLIEWVEIQLVPIKTAFLDVENLACDNLEAFFELSAASVDWDYTVMWIDCFATGKQLGRGVFSRANWAQESPQNIDPLLPHTKKGIPWPITMPSWTLNKLSVSLFNQLYRRRPAASFKGKQHYDSFFYPLDGLLGWNRLYGSKGFYQHQSIIPPEHDAAGITDLLTEITRSGQGSFLAVLKVHGPESSPGVMSFCREGVSLALDFANKGRATKDLLQRLDAIVEEYGGRCYAAKDGHMTARHFQETYPNWTEMAVAKDPRISSSFWRRVTDQD